MSTTENYRNYALTAVQEDNGKWTVQVSRMPENAVPHPDPKWTDLTFDSSDEALRHVRGQIACWVMDVAALYPFAERAKIIASKVWQ
jgi:hypothetical protein